MNDNEKWFEALRQWRIGGGVNRVVSLGDVDRHIAYVEELREREIGWTMTLSSLEEENEKLKAENSALRDMVQSLLGGFRMKLEKELIKENEKLKKENDELKLTINFAQSANWEFKEENEKLKAENENLAYTIRLLRSSP